MNLSNQEKETLLDALPDLAADGFQWDSYDDYRNYSGRVLRSLRRKGFIRDFLPYKKSFEVNVNGKDIYELVYHIVWDLEKMENLYQNLTSKNSNFDLG